MSHAMKQRKPELRQHPDHSLVPADDNDNDGQNEDLSSRPRPAQEFPAAQKFLALPASVSVTPLAGGSWGPRDPPDAPGSLCRHWVHMDARGPEAPGGDALRDAVSGDPRPPPPPSSPSGCWKGGWGPECGRRAPSCGRGAAPHTRRCQKSAPPAPRESSPLAPPATLRQAESRQVVIGQPHVKAGAFGRWCRREPTFS